MFFSLTLSSFSKDYNIGKLNPNCSLTDLWNYYLISLQIIMPLVVEKLTNNETIEFLIECNISHKLHSIFQKSFNWFLFIQFGKYDLTK